MGIYLRKSISVGPLRFNLSKSGVGVSAGIKGLRFGVGPRGNYVHMGRGGIYYRATLSPGTPRRPPSTQPARPLSPPIQTGTHAPLEEIESADISNIVDSSSRELLAELNSKHVRGRFGPTSVFMMAIAIFMAIYTNWPNWALVTLFISGLLFIYAAFTRDTLNKTVVLFYEFDAEMEEAYTTLHRAASKLASTASAWHIEASGKVLDRKYHAGASDLVSRKATAIQKTEPPYVKTNIETIAIGVGRQTLHFFPDRVLVYDTNGIGAVSYPELQITVKQTQFIEGDAVPRDAKVVGRTWTYVNKSGGPDRRFNNNREIPICLYEEISLSSRTGLNEVIQVSCCGFGERFSNAISLLATLTPKEKAEAA